MTDAGVLSLSQQFLRAVRSGADATEVRDEVAALDGDTLVAALTSDAERTAFWLNVYNATVQCVLREDPDRYDRRTFFSRELLTVAGESLSLDDVEHGILRRSQWKLGLGYVPNPFPSDFERTHRVGARDWRIHFALNCGAESCPPIAVYTAEGIDDELDLATESYLETEIEYRPEKGVAVVPRLLLWYRGDFGGRAGIYRILREYGPVPAAAKPRVRYAEYDWTLSLGRFVDRER
jgi:hypothetical protein